MHEEYIGFPYELPNVTLLEALDRGVLGSPIACKRGVAKYVLTQLRFVFTHSLNIINTASLCPTKNPGRNRGSEIYGGVYDTSSATG